MCGFLLSYLFNIIDLFDPPLMSLFTAKRRGKPKFYDMTCGLVVDETSADREDVCIIVLAGKFQDLFISAVPNNGADARKSVGDYCLALAGSTKDDGFG